MVGSDLQETLEQASIKFGEEIVELRSPNGGLIDDISLLRYTVTVFICVATSEGALVAALYPLDGCIR